MACVVMLVIRHYPDRCELFPRDGEEKDHGDEDRLPSESVAEHPRDRPRAQHPQEEDRLPDAQEELPLADQVELGRDGPAELGRVVLPRGALHCREDSFKINSLREYVSLVLTEAHVGFAECASCPFSVARVEDQAASLTLSALFSPGVHVQVYIIKCDSMQYSKTLRVIPLVIPSKRSFEKNNLACSAVGRTRSRPWRS